MSCNNLTIDRENRIIAAVDFFRFLPSSHLQSIHLKEVSSRRARAILARMAKAEQLRRFKHGQEYIYHIRPKNCKWQHDVLVAEAHFALWDCLTGTILTYNKEVKIDEAIADMAYKTTDGMVIMELDRGGNTINYGKYKTDKTVILVTAYPRKIRQTLPCNWTVVSLRDLKEGKLELHTQKRVHDKSTHKDWFQDGRESQNRVREERMDSEVLFTSTVFKGASGIKKRRHG